VARTGYLKIDTPFGSIRGRAHTVQDGLLVVGPRCTGARLEHRLVLIVALLPFVPGGGLGPKLTPSAWKSPVGR
jgi:hypothetical protein